MAQLITRLTTDQKIPGSNPGRLDSTFFLKFCEVCWIKNLISINQKSDFKSICHQLIFLRGNLLLLTVSVILTPSCNFK